TSARPYKKAWPVQEALDHLQQKSGSQFDPELVALFIDNIEQVQECKSRFSDN
ncbi:MAG: putative two-component system response regulator, partial [Halioglobus sp.]